MNVITELSSDPIYKMLVSLNIIALFIIGILFLGFCVVITVGDTLFSLYEYLQRKRRPENND